MKQHHVAIVCSSRKRAEQFYETILGLSLIKTIPLGGELAQKIFDTPDECEVFLYGNEHFAIEVFVTGIATPKSDIYVHLCLEVDDKRHFADTCEAQDLEVRRIPRGDDIMVFVKDFDGNLFEIKETPKS